MVEKCTSCKVEIGAGIHHVAFKCPSCTEAMIYRCDSCRKKMVNYKCPKCKFEGP